MNKGFLNILIIGIIAAVVLIGAGIGGYLVFWKNNVGAPTANPIISTSTSVQLNAPSSSLTIDTSNWQTYRNEKYGFEFKYPDSFKLYPNETNPQDNFTFQSKSVENGTTYITSIGNTFILWKEGFTEWLADLDKSYLPLKGRTPLNISVLNESQIKIDGRSVISRWMHQGVGNFYSFDTYIDFTPKGILWIKFGKSGPQNKPIEEKLLREELEKLNNQILSTFKFIESSSTADFFKVVSPNGREIIQRNTTLKVVWDYKISGNPEEYGVDIFLKRAGGGKVYCEFAGACPINDYLGHYRLSQRSADIKLKNYEVDNDYKISISFSGTGDKVLGVDESDFTFGIDLEAYSGPEYGD